MLLGLSPEAWGGVGACAGVVGTGAAAVFGWVGAANKRAHDLEKGQIDKDVAGLEAKVKAAFVILDDLRFNAVRKQDQDKLREEFRGDMRALGDRLEAAITALRNDIHRGNPGGA